jgi:glycine C-acetyltransferase
MEEVQQNHSRTVVSNLISEFVKEATHSGVIKNERVIENCQGTMVISKGVKRINFCANNYLGLANHPRVI